MESGRSGTEEVAPETREPGRNLTEGDRGEIRRVPGRPGPRENARGTKPTITFLAIALVGVLAFLVVAATSTSRQAFSLNAPASAPAVVLQRGSTACQFPINVPIGGEFRAVQLQLGTFRRPGPAFEISLRDAQDRVLARRTVAAGYPDIDRPSIDLGRSFDGRGYRLCVENRGSHPLAIYGTDGGAVPSSAVEQDGKPVNVDLALNFERGERSKLATLGDTLERATLFRSPRLSAAVYGILLVLLLTGAGAALLTAIRHADRED